MSVLHRVAETLEPRTLLDGLTGQYFNRLDFTEPVLTRVDPSIDYTWAGTPASGVRGDFFSVRWTGQLRPDRTETYTITSNTDDGCRVWLDGKMIIDEWHDQMGSDCTAQVPLEKDRKYDLKVEFYNGATKLGEDSPAPYAFTWSNVPAGTYSLSAKAIDNRSGVTAATVASVVVNALPTVTLDSPAPGARCEALRERLLGADLDLRFLVVRREQVRRRDHVRVRRCLQRAQYDGEGGDGDGLRRAAPD
jgi:hypothetical protein